MSNIIKPNYLTVRQFSENHPAFSESALRFMIFKAKPRKCSKGDIAGNGLLKTGAIIHLGRRVLIDENKFLEWVATQA